MKIAVIAAMSKEIALLLPLIENHTEQAFQNATYHLGRIHGHDVIVTQSEIGKVNAALATQRLIEAFHPDLIINTGVAGGLGKTKVLDVIMPAAVAYHDVWCGPGTVGGQADGCPPTFACLTDPRLAETDGINNGLIASGDIFVSKESEVRQILEMYPDAVAVDMESASIAHTCFKYSLPFACIRVVSDTPGSDDNIAQYESFWEDAPRAGFSALISFIKTL